ncbi:MAG TPA: electron transfer flavoprotein-ubiquinone oxidoreductase [Terriglobia bacterium]|nr:electron transfer flavoprotein-ubiquinone oxidoreductase [Terriglobia bacterium]
MQREILEVDVLIVGAGPAGLAAAYRLRQLAKAANRDDFSIAVLEKGKEVGAHILSGAVMDPRGIDELMPDWKERGAPVERPVEEDHFVFLARTWSFTLPITPPPLRNHGNFIVSLSRLTRWLGAEVEKSGVDVFTGFAGSELLMEGERVIGVRTGDKGVDKAGRPKGNFEPGIDIHARVTILAEGARGSLTKRLTQRLRLDSGQNPQVYTIGVKEIWDVPKQREAGGWVFHTMGWPLRADEFGGGFIYNMAEGKVSIGLVAGLDYHDPRFDPQVRLQEFKTHPFVRRLLEGGSLYAYGAKAIPEGGYWALPRYYCDGALMVGDTAGFLNAMRLKGIHLGIKSGMLAAEAAFAAIEADDTSSVRLRRFEELVEHSWIKEELWKVRNFHQGFENGLFMGMLHTGLQMITGGRGVRDRYTNQPGHARMRRLKDFYGAPVPPPVAVPMERPLMFDKLTDVYHSGTEHEEDQPVHLVVVEPDICHTRCIEEYGNPCQFFCPAAVYAMAPNAAGDLRLEINASNCVHCKTCDIMDPYQVIDWVTPEGAGGPSYDRT